MDFYYSRVVEPVADVFSLAYVIVAMCCALVLARNTERPFLSFVLLFWIIGQPVLNAYYTISTAWLPFDFQPNRIFLIILIPAIVYLKMQGSSAHTGEVLRFQKYLMAFIFFVVLSMVANFGQLSFNQLITIPLEPITFLLLFIFVRIIITKSLMTSIFGAIIVVALLNSIVAFYQFLDPYFLRTADLRRAFGGIFRSYGTFSSGYTFGSTLIVAFFVALFSVESKLVKFILLVVFTAALFTTFHRMSLLILFMCLAVCLVMYSSRIVAIMGSIALALGIIFVILSYSLYSSSGGGSQYVEERLKENTIAGRIEQFRVALAAIPDYPLGLGSEQNPIYQSTMIEAGLKHPVVENGYKKYIALTVHNGFLLAGILYGIGAMLFFTMMLVSMMLHFYRNVDVTEKSTLIPLLAVIAWTLGNMSNGLVVFRIYNVLLIAILVGAFVDYGIRCRSGVGFREIRSSGRKRPLLVGHEEA